MKATRSTPSLIASLHIILAFLFFLQSSPAQTAEGRPSDVFTNPQSITINTSGSIVTPSKASKYPTDIAVTGMTGNISRVAVTLTGLSALRPQDLDFLLVSPTGAKFIFLADGQAGLIPVEDAVYTFADDAPSAFPVFGYGFSGSYKPTSGDSNADTFPAPAPPGPYNQPPAASFASVFNGSSPNGTWSLYMVDDAIGGTGSLNSGWKLTITTDGAPATFTNTEQIGINEAYTAASPYGSGINVAGLSGVISKVRVTLNGFSHVSPSEVDVFVGNPGWEGNGHHVRCWR
jgi:hypothetical protein